MDGGAAAKRNGLPSPPKTSFLAFGKSEESAGVLAMMDELIKELETEITQGELEEKDAQGDYETLMKDSADKRAEDAKTLTDKEAAKAEMETEFQTYKDEMNVYKEELTATKQYIATLHG